MDASDDLSSLLALVNSHLSKTTLQSQPSTSIDSLIFERTGIQLPPPDKKLLIPSLTLNQPFKSDPLLALQVANSIKVREARLQKERDDKERDNREREERELAEKLKKVVPTNDDYMIDLTSAIIEPADRHLWKPVAQEPTPMFDDEDDMGMSQARPGKPQIIEPPLPYSLDHSDILNVKMKRKRVSSLGKVICARYIPKHTPNVRTKYKLDIRPYMFTDPSPDDLMKMKKPQGFDVMAYYGLEKSESLQQPKEKAKQPQPTKKKHWA